MHCKGKPTQCAIDRVSRLQSETKVHAPTSDYFGTSTEESLDAGVAAREAEEGGRAKALIVHRMPLHHVARHCAEGGVGLGFLLAKNCLSQQSTM